MPPRRNLSKTPNKYLNGKKAITKPSKQINNDMQITLKHFTLIIQLYKFDIEHVCPIYKNP